MAAESNPGAPTQGSSEPPHEALTVLVVEDDQVVMEMLRRYLDRLGHHALQARNGLEALALLDTHYVDVVLCDVRMPVLDGPSLAEYLHALTKRPRLILIGRDLRAPGIAPALHYADAVLPKPIVLASLERALAEVRS